jgi:two-component system, sensor histidine kinase LadS
MRRVNTLFVFLIFFTGKVWSIDDFTKVVLSQPDTIFPIGKNLLLFQDNGQRMSFAEILNVRDMFTQSTDNIPNFGAGAAVVWSKFVIKNNTPDEWYLEIETPYLNKIDLYSTDQYGKTEQYNTGLDKSFTARQVKVTTFILPLNLKAGEEKTYYLRIESESTLKLVLHVATLKKFYEVNQRKDIAHGIYFGLVIALSLYNLFVFFSLKDRTYFFYVLYILLTASVIGWLRGFTHEFLLQNHPYLNEGNYFAALTFIFFALFSVTFLRLETYAPKLKRLAWFFYFVATITILLTLFRQRVWGFYGVVFMVNTIIPFVLIIGIKAWRSGFTPAKYYLLGFFVFTVGDVVFVLKDLALIPRTLITEYAFEIGSALEAIILSFALANKLNTFKKEKEESQAKAISQANEFSKQLIQSQEEERQLVAQELQDSVGQSLSALKNQTTLLRKECPAPELIDDVNEVITGAIQEVRDISYGLRPFQLDLLGLTQAVKSLISEVSSSSGVNIVQEIDDIDNLFEKEAEINLYRIIQECTTNIIKHANAINGKIKITVSGNVVSVLIEDDGIGIGREDMGKGLGLIGIKERVSILNGKIDITDNSQRGTSISIKFEVAEKNPKNTMELSL